MIAGDRRDRRTDAYHEAAHAVISCNWGHPPIFVLIDGPELEPRNKRGASLGLPTGDPIVDISVAAAGYLAQLRLDPDDHASAMCGLGLIEAEQGTRYAWDSDYEHMLYAATPDYPRVWRAARRSEQAGGMTRAQRDHYLRTRPVDRDLMWGVAGDVAKLLDDPAVWGGIERVADALLARGRLSGRDVVDLVACRNPR